MRRSQGLRQMVSWRNPPPHAEGGKDRVATRAPSDSTFVTTVAKSSRSGSRSATGGRGSLSSRVSLPLTLFEYSFPPAPPPSLQVSERFPDQAQVDFLNSEAGHHMRRLERAYATALRQFLIRSVQLAGARVLVLGSGAPASLIPILERGVSHATFVDVSQVALDALRSSLDARGVHAFLDAEYVCQDAIDFLRDVGEPEFDLVIATKCVGMILGSRPGRTADALLSDVCDVLRPNGSFVTDHHQAFSHPSQVGRPIGSDLAPPEWDAATVAGRYVADVGYTWDIAHHTAALVTRFCPTKQSATGIQEWHVFHFRVPHADLPRHAAVISARTPPMPVPLSIPQRSTFDPVVDAMIPVNHKGNKRVPVATDSGGFDISRLRVKFDGTPGVLTVEGRVALFMSPTLSFAVGLGADVSPPLVLTAELVPTREGDAVIVANGLISLGETRADPNDNMAFSSVSRVLEGLAPYGILAATPDLTRLLRGDHVVLSSPTGRGVSLPVDGVSPLLGGSYGVFLKPARRHTVDAKPSEVAELVWDAHAALGAAAPNVRHPSTDIGPDEVWEYEYNPDSVEWVPVRLRGDKTWSDTPGAVVHTVCACLSAYKLGHTGTVENLVREIGR